MRKIKVCKYQGNFNHRIDILLTILVIHGIRYKLMDILHLGKGQILDVPKLSSVNYEKGTYTLILSSKCSARSDSIAWCKGCPGLISF